MVILSLLFFYTSETVTRVIVDINQRRMEIVKAVDLIKATEGNLPVYFLWDDQNSPVYYIWDTLNVSNRMEIDRYQFLLKNKKIHFVNANELRSIQDDKFIVLGEFKNLFDLLEENEYCMTAADSYLLLSRDTKSNKDSVKEINLPLQMFEASNAEKTSQFIQTNGTKGLFMCGPFISINKGKYEFIVNMSLADYSHEDLGHIDVYSPETEEVYTQVNLDRNTFMDSDEFLVTIPFDLYKDVESLALYAYVNEGTQLKINSVWIKKNSLQ